MVDDTLARHFEAIKTLTENGTYFFDYGNAFMKSVYDSGITEISKNGRNDKDGFIWPSYVEDIMGPMLFDYGYGPFRWVCLSGKHEDLVATDKAAMEAIDPDPVSYTHLDVYKRQPSFPYCAFRWWYFLSNATHSR